MNSLIKDNACNKLDAQHVISDTDSTQSVSSSSRCCVWCVQIFASFGMNIMYVSLLPLTFEEFTCVTLKLYSTFSHYNIFCAKVLNLVHYFVMHQHCANVTKVIEVMNICRYEKTKPIHE